MSWTHTPSYIYRPAKTDQKILYLSRTMGTMGTMGKVWDRMLKDPLLTCSSQCRPWVPMSQCPSLSQSILSYPILSYPILTRTFFFLYFAWVHAGKVWDRMLKDPLLTCSSQCRPWVPMSQCPSLSQSILSYPILSYPILSYPI